ncbi:UNVERIFIED_CONTAM: hypothetical protein RMT77_015801 [Armadillidium vulgare]
MDEVVVVETEIRKGMLSSESLSSESVNGDRGDNDILFVGSQELNCQVDLGSNITKCCVPNCVTSKISNISSSQISFVTFPKDPSRFTEWIRAIGRPDLLSYLGKKEATNLLICSKHFPRNMWVNSNTRLKRLHKSAVPEKSYDDDIDIISITPLSEKTSSARKTGIKVKKVTSLLTDSALRAALTSPVKNTSPTIKMPDISPSIVDSPMEFKGRKLPLILPRPKSLIVSSNTPAILKHSKAISRTPKTPVSLSRTSKTPVSIPRTPKNPISLSRTPKSPISRSTEMEKLSLENRNLKEELDKNMDFILSQKAHYEGIIAKERESKKEIQNKVTTLETSQRKLCQSYENQIQSKNASDSKEIISKMKKLQQTNESFEKRLEVEMQTVQNLQAINNELESQIEELLQEKGTTPITHPPTPVKPLFTGENFKDFLHLYLDKEKQLEEKVTDLLVEVNKATTAEGKKENILNEASCYLNHLHLSWLRWVLNMEKKETDFEERLWEFALSIYDISKEAYVKCAKAFGLPSSEEIKKYAKDPSSSKGNANSLINALYDEAEMLPSKELVNKTVFDSDKGYDDVLDYEGKSKKRSLWNQNSYSKKFKNDDDEEEGKVSDEDEEVVFTDSEEEEEEEEDDDDESDNEREVITKEEVIETDIITKEEVIDPKDILSSNIKIPVASTSSQDFDFMVDPLDITRGETSLRTNIQQQQQQNHVHSMPLLDLDSSMTISRRDIINSNSSADLKISNRKKVISSDTSLPSGSKVVFRVIES